MKLIDKKSNPVRMILAFAVILGTVGCGNKGELYLPKGSDEAPTEQVETDSAKQTKQTNEQNINI